MRRTTPWGAAGVVGCLQAWELPQLWWLWSPGVHRYSASMDRPDRPPNDRTPPNNAEATALTPVTENGVEYNSDFVAVTAPAGVAPVGTALSIAPTEAPIPGEWAAFATPAAPAVEITLGAGEQPRKSITINFKGVERTDATFVITETGGQVALLPRLPTGTLTTETEHLSRFWPVTVDVTRYASYAVEYVANALQITAPAPACYQSDGLYPDVGARISRVAGDAAWPCISRTERSSVEFSFAVQFRTGMDSLNQAGVGCAVPNDAGIS